jgi:hypothetical protein
MLSAHLNLDYTAVSTFISPEIDNKASVESRAT